MKGVIYVRVSTDDKDQNPQRQIEPVRRYFKEHNITEIKIIKDHYTGNSNPYERPNGQWLIKHWDDWDAIGVFSLSRFSREHPIKVFGRLDKLKNNNKKIISVTENAFNMDSEFSDIIIYIISWFNNYYLKELKKNVLSGLENARANGKKLGRPYLDDNIVSKIRDLKNNNGYSNNKIASILNISPHTVKRYLH